MAGHQYVRLKNKGCVLLFRQEFLLIDIRKNWDATTKGDQRMKHSIFLAFGLIFGANLSGAATQMEGCIAFSEIGERAAHLRDGGKSQAETLSAMRGAGINLGAADFIAGTVYEDMQAFAPDAVRHILFTYCMTDPSILVDLL